jgi:hypothetical protein
MKPDIPLTYITIITILLIATVPVMAAETNDVSAIHGWDITDIITVFTTILAAILGVISFIGYRRDQRTKFLLVTLAFTIFALKGVFILSGDLLALRQSLFDIIASLLDFAVLVCVFLSITMK